MSSRPASVLLREVSPRDGLQSLAQPLPTASKVRLIDALSGTGLPVIEAAAFVRPDWTPQMADSEEVMNGIQRNPRVRYSALVPNMRGYERARSAGAEEIVLMASASETYSQKNTNRSIQEGIAKQAEVVATAAADGVGVSVDVSMSFGCPYEGHIPAERVVDVVGQLVALGVEDVYLADTTGTCSPRSVTEVAGAVHNAFPDVELGLHLHDGRGLALASVFAALDLGLARFDCSIGGVGGSLHAEGATGNVATEDLVYMLESIGISTGVDLEKLLEVGALMEEILARPLASKLLRAGLPKGWKS